VHPPSEVSLFHRIGFPLGPSGLAFALNSCGSILNTTGPALRGLAGWWREDRGNQTGARLWPGTEWFVELNRYAVGSNPSHTFLILQKK
jgi:hypothetical protein